MITVFVFGVFVVNQGHENVRGVARSVVLKARVWMRLSASHMSKLLKWTCLRTPFRSVRLALVSHQHAQVSGPFTNVWCISMQLSSPLFNR